jgi:hypothetical protein
MASSTKRPHCFLNPLAPARPRRWDSRRSSLRSLWPGALFAFALAGVLLPSGRTQDATRGLLGTSAPTVTAAANDTAQAPGTGAGNASDPASPNPTAPAEADEVVVNASDLEAERDEIAPSLGANTYTIGQNQIQTLSQGDNSSFQQVLLHAPGVVEEEFGEVHIRGDHGNVQYRINGVLLPESLNGFGQEIDPHLISSVTLITGTLPAQFGDRTAGIVDITTKSGEELNGNEVSLYGGSYDTIHPAASFGGTTSNLDYFVTANSLHDNLGIDNTTSSNDPLHDFSDQESLFGYFSHPFDKSSRVTLLLSASYADFEIPDTAGLASNYSNSQNSTPADSAKTNENQNEQNYYGVLSYQKSAGNLFFQVSGFSRYVDIRFAPDSVQDLLLNGNAAHVINSDFANGVQADGSYFLGEHNTIRFGLLANYNSESLDTKSVVFPSSSQFAFAPTGENLPAPTLASSAIPETIIANGGNSGLTAGIYLQDEWHPFKQLTINFGARFDRFDVSFEHEGQLSPRINLVLQPDDATTAHIGYARYFMPPTLQYVPPSTAKAFEYTTDAPFSDRDDPPQVERDHYFDAGISRQIIKPWQINLDSFIKLASNLQDDGQFGTAVILNNFNYTSGTVYGVEASSTYTQGPVTAYGNFSYVQTWAKTIDTVENEFPDNELGFLADHHFQLDHQGRFTGSGGVALTLLKDTQLHSDFLYEDGLRSGFANQGKQPSYTTVNVGVEHTWRLKAGGVKDLKARFDCLNIFDNIYEVRNGTGLGIAAPAYGPRRSFYGGVTLGF